MMAMLHVVNNDNHVPRGQPGYDPLFKIRPVLDHMILTFETVYRPQQRVTVDEGMIGWRGNLGFRVSTY
jgi:hypothetical protein